MTLAVIDLIAVLGYSIAQPPDLAVVRRLADRGIRATGGDRAAAHLLVAPINDPISPISFVLQMLYIPILVYLLVLAQPACAGPTRHSADILGLPPRRSALSKACWRRSRSAAGHERWSRR
jgi:hypothetical protein